MPLTMPRRVTIGTISEVDGKGSEADGRGKKSCDGKMDDDEWDDGWMGRWMVLPPPYSLPLAQRSLPSRLSESPSSASSSVRPLSFSLLCPFPIFSSLKWREHLPIHPSNDHHHSSAFLIRFQFARFRFFLFTSPAPSDPLICRFRLRKPVFDGSNPTRSGGRKRRKSDGYFTFV